MSATLTNRRFGVVTPRRPIALCESCGATHDPYDSGEWRWCEACVIDVLDAQIAAAGAA